MGPVGTRSDARPRLRKDERSRVLVIGGAGYICGHVAAALRRSGHEVLRMTRDPAGAGWMRLASSEVVPVVGDLSDLESYRARLDTVGAVVQVAIDSRSPVDADLRPAIVYGASPRSSLTGRWFQEATDGIERFYSSRSKTWSWVHVDDLADVFGAWRAVTHAIREV